jgi:GAF domain-containing protein
MAVQLPAPEAERLAALRALKILDTPPDPEFDDLTHLAAALFQVPYALVTLVDSERQWFKSRYGVTATETPREISFCDHAIRQGDVFLIPNAAEDEHFKSYSCVTGEPNVRFYAGVPLTDLDGYPLGTMCVFDNKPRQISTLEKQALTVLARQASAYLRLKQQAQLLELELAERRRVEEELRALQGLYQELLSDPDYGAPRQ